jgi:antitoxin component of RelBE/YafQ-DinJ toxin-antitoxin module
MTRSAMLRVRVSEDELEAFDRVAKKRGLTRSALVRSLLHETAPVAAVLSLPEIVLFTDFDNVREAPN